MNKPLRVSLLVLWVAGVLAAMALIVFRFDEYGLWGIAALVMGVAMLVIFVGIQLGERGTGSGLLRHVSDYATAVLFLAVIALLALTFAAAVRDLSLFGILVIGLFLFTFIRIFRDFIRHLRKKHRESQDR